MLQADPSVWFFRPFSARVRSARVFLADRGALGYSGRRQPGPHVSFARKPHKPVQPRAPVAREESARDGASGVSVAVLRALQSFHGTGDGILDAVVPRGLLLRLVAGQELLRRGV